jgi:hypothetical protein
MKAMDFCFGSVELTDRRGKPMGVLNYSWKTKVILDSNASRPTGKSLDFGRIEKSSTAQCQSADEKRRTLERKNDAVLLESEGPSFNHDSI